jgi:DNA invertase Pin-like site-specific DNA recombinase
MLIGYARVSRIDQNLDQQIIALETAGCEKIFSDKISGSRFEREGLNSALDYLRPNDTLVIWKLDRLGRSVRQLLSFVDQLKEKSVHLKSLTDSIDTSTPSGRFFFNVMASLAEMERDLIIERTRAALDIARQKGRFGGRPRLFTESKKEKARLLIASGMSAKEVAEDFGVSIKTLYRHLPASDRGDEDKPPNGHQE